MTTPRPSLRLPALVLAASFLLAGCQPAEVGTIGREAASDEPLPTGPEPSQVKGKVKPASNMETRASRK